MKKLLLLALLAAPIPAFADPMDLPNTVRSAFVRAGLPLYKEKRRLLDFSLSTTDGKLVSLSQYRGKVVFLNFWATWCPPCRDEMPSMEALYQQFHERGLEIIACDIMERPDTVEKFMKSNKLTFPAVLDTSGKVSSQYGVQGVPATFIIDRDGKIILSLVGGIDWSTPSIVAAFSALLDNRGR